MARDNQAVAALGYKHAPPVNHSAGWRDANTGYHSSDVESENNRVKAWSRSRYGRLSLSALELHEYAYYINVGNPMTDIMKGMATASGGQHDAFEL